MGKRIVVLLGCDAAGPGTTGMLASLDLDETQPIPVVTIPDVWPLDGEMLSPKPLVTRERRSTRRKAKALLNGTRASGVSAQIDRRKGVGTQGPPRERQALLRSILAERGRLRSSELLQIAQKDRRFRRWGVSMGTLQTDLRLLQRHQEINLEPDPQHKGRHILVWNGAA